MNAPLTHTPSHVPGRPLRLFLVEDSAAVRAALVESLGDISNLEMAGYSETEADALCALSHQTYDIIIFDIELRQGNGMSLLRSLTTARASHDSLKIIFSNNVSSAYRRIGAQYGVQHFFDKTSELTHLHAVLEQATHGVALD